MNIRNYRVVVALVLLMPACRSGNPADPNTAAQFFGRRKTEIRKLREQLQTGEGTRENLAKEYYRWQRRERTSLFKALGAEHSLTTVGEPYTARTR